MQHVNEGIVFIQNTQVAFGEIMGAVEDTTSQIEDVSASTLFEINAIANSLSKEAMSVKEEINLKCNQK